MEFDLKRELHKPVIQKFKRVKIYSLGIDHIWAADLCVLTTFSKENKGYNKYILAVIDCFNKYVWCVALKKKNAEDVTDVFEQILNNSKRKPQLLHTDMGRVYKTGNLKNYSLTIT